MKTTISILLAVALLAALPCAAMAQDFYFCGDSTYNVSVSNTKITIQFDSSYIGLDMAQFRGNHPCLAASVPPQDLGRNFATFPL